MGQKPLLEIILKMQEQDTVDDFLLWSGSYNQMDAYASTVQNVLINWGALLVMVIVFAAAAVIALKSIDRDKR